VLRVACCVVCCVVLCGVLSAQRPSSLLSLQYRMHPEISLFPSQHFYGGRLLDAPTTLDPCNWAAWVHVSESE
jgi:hypothetical protein